MLNLSSFVARLLAAPLPSWPGVGTFLSSASWEPRVSGWSVFEVEVILKCHSRGVPGWGWATTKLRA
eukprot:2896854-Alexandrium_andersonii.AAC.1